MSELLQKYYYSDFIIKFAIITAIIYIVFIFFRWISYFFADSIIKTSPNMNIFGYKIFYADQKIKKNSNNIIQSKILTSKRYGLKGKPDFILKSKFGSSLIPIELKSGTIKENLVPRQGDLMQLAAYFIIIEDYFGIVPKSGRLIYKDYMFIIKNTKKLRNILLETVDDMRDMLDGCKQYVEPSFVMCKHCVCRGTVCEYCY